MGEGFGCLHTRAMAAVQIPLTSRLTPRRALSSCAAIGGLSLSLAVLYRNAGIGVPCPLLLLTGIQCPFCGGTRMVASLLSGDLAAAWHYNPLLFLVGVGIGVRAAGWVVELVRKPAGAPVDVWAPPWLRRHATAIAVAVGIVYIVARAVW